VKISIASELKKTFHEGGRLLLYFSTQNQKEPRQGSAFTVGFTPLNWDGRDAFILDSKATDILGTGAFPVSGMVYCKAVYKNNLDDAQDNAPGNWYSTADSLAEPTQNNFNLTLQNVMVSEVVQENKFVKSIEIQSRFLSKFSGHPRYLKASMLLPATFFDHPDQSFPVCYRAAGLNGRYTVVNNTLKDKEFMDWWFSGNAPQVVYVFLDSQGPYGDTYQVDSENNGPCGRALTEELIPEIEKLVHYNPATKMRFLTGYSTGGWVSLGLQVFYPDFFDGTWSYSPDPVDFSHYGLIDIYKDLTIFYNKYGYLQPGKRTIYDEPTFSMKEWISGENLVSRTGDYRISGGQFGAYNAVFGPKGKDGLPSLMFDPLTGKIDHSIAVKWEKYDLKKVLETNWTMLGPKLQGKIWIWTGDADGLYSNVATRFLKMYLDGTQNPKSDAKISFTPLAGHCQEWSDIAVLKMIAEKAAGK
jgi:S-formylglutathione hydrolase FrmB